MNVLLNACAVCVTYVPVCVCAFLLSLILSVYWVDLLHTPTHIVALNAIHRDFFFINSLFDLDSCSSFPGVHTDTQPHCSHRNIFTSTPTIPSHMTASKLLILLFVQQCCYILFRSQCTQALYVHIFILLGFCSFSSKLNKSFFDRIKNRTNFFEQI